MTTDVKLSTTDSGNVVNFSSGSFTSNGNATQLNLGFTARYVKVVNSTDAIIWEKIEGMAAANTVKITGTPTEAVDTGSAIVVDTDTGYNAPGLTVTLSATLCGTSKAISWIAFG
jgi:hypothetical protein